MKRRANGEGTIKTRADGRKEGQIWLEGKRRYVYGKTEKEVREKLKKLIRAHEQGADLDQKDQRLDAFLDRWLEEVVRPSGSPRTHEYYKGMADRHVKPALGHLKLRELTPPKVSAFLAGLPNTLKSTTKAKAYKTLRAALTVAVQWRLVEYNAAALVKAPKEEDYEAHAITLEEAAAFQKAIKGHPMEPLYLLGMLLGLRKGELLGLRKRDVDLEAEVLYIRGQAQRIEGSVVWRETKTKRSRRRLPIPAPLKEPLREVIARQPESEWLFPSENGTLLSPNNLVRQFKALLKKAGLPQEIRIHDLRHFAASNMLRNGVRVEQVSELLGHADVTTTLNTYAHVLPHELGTAVEMAVKGLMPREERAE